MDKRKLNHDLIEKRVKLSSTELLNEMMSYPSATRVSKTEIRLEWSNQQPARGRIAEDITEVQVSVFKNPNVTGFSMPSHCADKKGTFVVQSKAIK